MSEEKGGWEGGAGDEEQGRGNQTETCEEKPFDFEQAGICDVVGEFHLVGFERLDAKAEELAFVGEVEVDFGGLEFS